MVHRLARGSFKAERGVQLPLAPPGIHYPHTITRPNLHDMYRNPGAGDWYVHIEREIEYFVSFWVSNLDGFYGPYLGACPSIPIVPDHEKKYVHYL